MLLLVAEHVASLPAHVPGASVLSPWKGGLLVQHLLHMHDLMEHHVSVGSTLRERREALDLSREALGAAAGGISSTTIWRLENGTVRPHRSTVAALARALGVSVEHIVPTKNGGSGHQPNPPEERGAPLECQTIPALSAS